MQVDEKMMPRRFHLLRKKDVSGVSGTGIVAFGVQFYNGKCALSWATPRSSIGFYDSILDLEAISGHEGSTEVVWDD
jgi:hypothetical protein